MIFLAFLSLVFLAFQSSEAFVYTCNEIKYNLVPNNIPIATPFACIVHQSNVHILFDDEPFNGENVRDLFLVDDGDGEKYNFIDIANSTDRCLSGTGPWRIESDTPIEQLDCDLEVTLLFSSTLPNIFLPKTLGEFLDSDVLIDDEVTIVSPNGGLDFDMFFLEENATGLLDWYSGVGAGPEEELVFLKTLQYASDDSNLYIMGPVATLRMTDPFVFGFIVNGITGSYTFSYSPIGFDVISSGAASTLQSTQNERIQINFGLGAIVTLAGSVVFDADVPTSITVNCTDYDDVVWGEIEITDSGEVNWSSQCRFFDFNYYGNLPKTETSRRSGERIDLSITSVALPTLETTTMELKTTTRSPTSRRTMPPTSSTSRTSTTTRTSFSTVSTTAPSTTTSGASDSSFVVVLLLSLLALLV